jgi:hypothetical protein
VYWQNVSGIFDRDGIGLDSAFKEIKQTGADIFMYNKTHGDEMQQQEGHDGCPNKECGKITTKTVG